MIQWEVQNRFRLFRAAEDFQRQVTAQRAGSVLQAERLLERDASGRGWARTTVDRLCLDVPAFLQKEQAASDGWSGLFLGAAFDPPKRLVIDNWENQFRPEIKAEGASTCTIELEPVGEAVKVTITHVAQGPRFIEAVSGGWPKILSNLKSLLETGNVAPYTLKFTHKSNKHGFAYACNVHGGKMTGHVIVKK